MDGIGWDGSIMSGVCGTVYGMPGDACDVLSTFPTWTTFWVLSKLIPNFDGSNVGGNIGQWE